MFTPYNDNDIPELLLVPKSWSSWVILNHNAKIKHEPTDSNLKRLVQVGNLYSPRFHSGGYELWTAQLVAVPTMYLVVWLTISPFFSPVRPEAHGPGWSRFEAWKSALGDLWHLSSGAPSRWWSLTEENCRLACAVRSPDYKTAFQGWKSILWPK